MTAQIPSKAEQAKSATPAVSTGMHSHAIRAHESGMHSHASGALAASAANHSHSTSSLTAAAHHLPHRGIVSPS